MRKFLFGLILVGLITAAGYYFMGLRLPGQAAPLPPTPTVAILPPARVQREVVADASVVPIRSAVLSMPTGGVVSQLLVSEGDFVEAGQLLLGLNAARQEASLAQAQAELRRAQARLAETIAGSRVQEIAAAQASVEAAEAQLDKVKQGPKQEDVEAAQASVASARAELNQVFSGPDEQELIAAKAELDNAEATRRNAQSSYDRIAGNPDAGRYPEALELEKATNEYNAAFARYQALQEGPDPSEVAAARAKVDRAQAELDALLAPPSAAEIAAAEAEVRRAQAELDLRLAGARDEEVAAAQADVAAAEANVDQARAAVAETELVAPFDGVIASLDVVLGQQVAAGEPTIQMADYSAWRIETDDLTELEVVGIQPGDYVAVTFDAIPGLELPGRVLRIKSIGENRQGDITYTVIVSLDQSDERLLWNMTATVNLVPGDSAEELVAVQPSPTPEPPTVTPTWTVEPPTATPTEPPTAIAEPLTATAVLSETLLEVAAVDPVTVPTAVGTEAPTIALTETLALTPLQTSTPTPTETPTPTSTSTLPPTATATNTSTPTPTATRTPTATTSPQATRSSGQPTATAVTRPPTAAPVPTATPTPFPVVSAPDPVNPAPNQTVNGVVAFQWLPTGPLPEGALYEVVWWNPEDNPASARGIAAATTETSLSANLDVLYDSNQITGLDIYWTVLPVRIDPYQRLIQPADSSWRVLRYQPPSGGGSPSPPKPR